MGLAIGEVARDFTVRIDRGPPLDVLIAEDALQAALRDWPASYRALMDRCREMLGCADVSVADSLASASWAGFEAALGRFSEDFMSERVQPPDGPRGRSGSRG